MGLTVAQVGALHSPPTETCQVTRLWKEKGCGSWRLDRPAVDISLKRQRRGVEVWGWRNLGALESVWCGCVEWRDRETSQLATIAAHREGATPRIGVKESSEWKSRVCPYSL